MKSRISDTHDSHGSVFTLSLEGVDSKDRDVIDFLNKQFKGKTSFYVYRVISIGKRILQIGFSESSIVLAKVDHMWNHDRDDLKFPVMCIDGLASQHDGTKHYSCHWCKKEVWGIQRETVEVYITITSIKKVLVNVHRECQEIRDRQVATIPFPETAVTVR